MCSCEAILDGTPFCPESLRPLSLYEEARPIPAWLPHCCCGVRNAHRFNQTAGGKHFFLCGVGWPVSVLPRLPSGQRAGRCVRRVRQTGAFHTTLKLEQ